MKSLTNNTTSNPIQLPLQVVEAINYEQMARSRYEHHTRLAKFYLRRTAILMGICLLSAIVVLFDGPKIFILVTIVISLVLLLTKGGG